MWIEIYLTEIIPFITPRNAFIISNERENDISNLIVIKSNTVNDGVKFHNPVLWDFFTGWLDVDTIRM